MDLSREFPRSPKQKIAGLVQLGRMIDKGRAYKEKRLADYISQWQDSLGDGIKKVYESEIPVREKLRRKG